MKEDKSIILILGLVVFFAAFVVVLCLFGTGQFADTLRGYELLNQYQNGGDFNTLSYPSTNNPEYEYFVTWWSPAQWFLIYSLLKIGMTIQVAQGILIVLFVGVGLYGYKKLFEALKVNKRINFLSLILILTSGFVSNQFTLYTGGDLFVFGLFPYYLLFVLRVKDYSNILFVVSFAVVTLALMFFKNTFLLIGFSSLAMLFLMYPKLLVKLIFAGAILMGMAYLNWLQFGETPGSAIDVEGYGITNNLLGDLFRPIGSVIAVLLNLDVITSAIVDKGVMGPELIHWIYGFFGALTIVISYKYWSKGAYVQRVVLGITIPFLAVMILLYLLDRAVSYDSRHFAVFAFLFFPLIIKALNDRLGRLTTGIFVGMILGLNLFVFSAREMKFVKEYKIYKGYAVNSSELKDLRVIENWIEKNPEGLIVLNNRWHLMPMINTENKICVTQSRDTLWVVSGMELDNADVVSPTLFSENSAIFVLRSNENRFLKKSLVNKKREDIKKRP